MKYIKSYSSLLALAVIAFTSIFAFSSSVETAFKAAAMPAPFNVCVYENGNPVPGATIRVQGCGYDATVTTPSNGDGCGGFYPPNNTWLCVCASFTNGSSGSTTFYYTSGLQSTSVNIGPGGPKCSNPCQFSCD